MATPIPSILLRVRYEKAADAALAQLTLEQIMEATPSATQRRITLRSAVIASLQGNDDAI